MGIIAQAARVARQITGRRPANLEDALDLAQRRWMATMEPFKSKLGVIVLPDYPQLTAEHVEGCVLLHTREEILRRVEPGLRIAEVGVQEGRFSERILELCAPCELHLYDVSLRHYGIPQKFAGQIGQGLVVLHEGDSSTLLNQMDDGFFDVIYIDGDHRYEGVKKDIAAATKKLTQDGLLIFNDYTYWSAAQCEPYGVVQAVNELCHEGGWKVVYFALGYFGYYDMALRRV
jgi:hypothetical protein